MQTKEERLRSDISLGIQDGKSGVDREKGIIYGFAVVTKGLTKDRRGEFDEESLQTIVDFGNKSKMGIKSRFGHPNMSNTALGTFLGRVKNFKRDGDIVRGDLHIDKTAYKTPDGDLASYVMDLAESDSDAFGSSMVIQCDFEDRREKDDSPTKDEKGDSLVPLIKVKKLYEVDVVDDPAANEGMFGTFFSDSVKLSAGMTDFLDKFLNNPDAVDKTMDFLQRYSNNRDEFAEKFQCSCIKCGYEMESEEHCNTLKCPECGGTMRRSSRPGPGQEKQTENKNQNKEEVKEMETKELTLETLKADRSDLVDEILAEGNAAGVKLERERVLDIQEKAKAFEGMDELAAEMIKSGATIEEADSKFKDKKIADLEKHAPESQGPADDPEEGKGKMSHIDKAKKYQKENGGSMTDALSATASPRVKA